MARRRMQPATHLGLNATPSLVAPENALETFELGAVLVSSGGFVAEGGADPVDIIGIARNDGHNATTDGDENTRVAVAAPGTVFEGSVDFSGAIDTGTILAADRFAEFGIAEDADGVWYIDKTELVNTRVRIIDFKDAVGTLNGRVYFIFLVPQTIWA